MRTPDEVSRHRLKEYQKARRTENAVIGGVIFLWIIGAAISLAGSALVIWLIVTLIQYLGRH